MVDKDKQTSEPAGKHPQLAAAVMDEAARLRERARELTGLPAPPVPGTDKSEDFARLWAEAWRNECALIADRFGDAAKVLEDAAGGISHTRDLLNWRRPSR